MRTNRSLHSSQLTHQNSPCSNLPRSKLRHHSTLSPTRSFVHATRCRSSEDVIPVLQSVTMIAVRLPVAIEDRLYIAEKQLEDFRAGHRREVYDR